MLCRYGCPAWGVVCTCACMHAANLGAVAASASAPLQGFKGLDWWPEGGVVGVDSGRHYRRAGGCRPGSVAVCICTCACRDVCSCACDSPRQGQPFLMFSAGACAGGGRLDNCSRDCCRAGGCRPGSAPCVYVSCMHARRCFYDGGACDSLRQCLPLIMFFAGAWGGCCMSVDCGRHHCRGQLWGAVLVWQCIPDVCVYTCTAMPGCVVFRKAWRHLPLQCLPICRALGSFVAHIGRLIG